MTIKIGVPSKGRLMDKTFEWFGSRGVELSRSGSEREYAGAVKGVDGVELVLLSAGEIPRELAAGRIHLGVTGTDLIREKLSNWEQRVEELALLGFGHADLIIAVPDFWIDVRTLDDLDAAAAKFRARNRATTQTVANICASPPIAPMIQNRAVISGSAVPLKYNQSPKTSASSGAE